MINKVSNSNNNSYFKHSNIAFKARVVTPETGQAIIKGIKDKGAKRIYVIGHSSIDDDALNSALLWSHILKKVGIDAKVCAKSEQLNTLYMHKSPEVHRKLTKKPDLILGVDFNDVLKIPKLLVEMFEGKNQKLWDYKSGLFEGTDIIGIDHHIDSKTIKGDYYIDSSAKSCCGIMVRIADSLGIKLGKQDAKLAYCGMISDFRKGGLIEIEKGQLIKTPALYKDKNSLEILEKIEKKLTNKDRAEIHNYTDVMSRLTPCEKAFQAKLDAMVKITPNGKFAYAAIDPQDKDWAKIGMDTDTTSVLIRDFRIKTLKKFPELKAVAVFYRTSPKEHGVYRISLHSKEGNSYKLLKKAEELSGQPIGNGHPDRAGGKLASVDKTETDKFVKYFIEAAKEIN